MSILLKAIYRCNTIFILNYWYHVVYEGFKQLPLLPGLNSFLNFLPLSHPFLNPHDVTEFVLI